MDTYLPISEAALIAQVSEKILKQLVQSGKIRATMLATNGTILVNKRDFENQIPRESREEYQAHAALAGKGISMRQASVNYGIPHQTISRWVKRGIIKVIETKGRSIMIDAADMAYCAEIYKENRGQGKWLFDNNGDPYIKKVA